MDPQLALAVVRDAIAQHARLLESERMQVAQALQTLAVAIQPTGEAPIPLPAPRAQRRAAERANAKAAKKGSEETA